MAEDTSILSVSVATMEKLLDARFSKLEETLSQRLDSVEAKLDKQDEANRQLSRQLGDENAKVVKLLSTRFAEVMDVIQQQKAGGFFGKSRGVSPSPAAVTPAAAVGGNQAEESKLARLDDRMDAVLKRIDGQEAVVKKIEDMVTWTKNKMEQQSLQANSKDVTSKSASVEDDDSVKALMEEKFSKLNELTPKICQLHTNLDMLLTGESEANAIIDKLLPTVNKLQEEVSGLGKRFDAEMKELKDEHLLKIKDRLDDCKDDVKEATELVEDCKRYVKENLDLGEEIREKVKRQQWNPQHRRGGGQRYSDGGSSSMPQYKYSSDEDNDDGKDKSGSRDRSGDRTTVVKLDSDMKSQMITVHEKMDQIKNDIRYVCLFSKMRGLLYCGIFAVGEPT